MIQIFKMAYRNLGRNRRRSFFSMLALAIGLGLLLLVAGFFHGEMTGMIDLTVRLQSGHIQIRDASYDENKSSLKWEYLVADPEMIAAQVASVEQVRAASPRLFASGIIAMNKEVVGVRIFGIEPSSEVNAPYRDGLLSGEFLTADDREGVLVGLPLADRLDLQVGDQINIAINTSNGDVDEQLFTVRGIYSTDTNGFDSFIVFMPLAKAQTITRTEGYASTIIVMLHDGEQADAVAAALQGSQYQVLTWKEMNELILQTETIASGAIYIMYLIVLGITATIIINTLIMAVYERTREIGILSALGMGSRRIMAVFLAESSLLAVGGIIMGLVLGLLAVAYTSKNGFYVGDMGLTGFMIGNNIYSDLTVADAVTLTILAFIVTLLAGFYPAVLASRMEPVQALRGGK